MTPPPLPSPAKNLPLIGSAHTGCQLEMSQIEIIEISVLNSLVLCPYQPS